MHEEISAGLKRAATWGGIFGLGCVAFVDGLGVLALELVNNIFLACVDFERVHLHTVLSTHLMVYSFSTSILP